MSVELVSASVSPTLSVSKQLSVSDESLLLEELLAGRRQRMSTTSAKEEKEEDDDNGDDARDRNQGRLKRQEMLGKACCLENSKSREKGFESG